MLKYALRENLLTAESDDYMAQTVDARSYNGEQIVELMLKRGSTLTKADAAAAVELYNTVCAELVADGCNINTPLMNTSLSISGVFSGAADSFDQSRHAVRLNISAGTLLRDAAAKVRTEKTQAASTDPYIAAVRDVVSGAVNGTLTAGGIIEATGSRLKFDAADTEQGLFLLPESGEAVRCGVVAENKPARLIVMLPADMAAGAYHMEVRTKLDSSGKPTKSLKAGRFGRELTVAGAGA